MEQDLGLTIMHMSVDEAGSLPIKKPSNSKHKIENLDPENQIWKLFFDGSSSREGSGVGVVLISPTYQVISLSYKLEFETINNIAEFEALILGLKVTIEMGVNQISMFGDSKLIIQHVKSIY